MVRYFEDNTYTPKVLVDEAHNLISRSKEMYSAIISDEDLRKLRRLLTGYKPSSRTHNTVNNSPEAEELSFEISSDPIVVSDASTEKLKPLCHIEIDSRDFVTNDEKALLAALEKALYGDPEAASADTGLPYLPTPSQVRSLLTPAG